VANFASSSRYGMPMKKPQASAVQIFCLLASLVSVCYSQNSSALSKITIHETIIDLSNSANTNVTACAAIYADGVYHLERSTQRLDTFAVTPSVYEGVLNQSQIGHFLKIVNQPDVKSLPTYIQPFISPPNHFIHSFILTTDRDGDLQQVGYSIWKSINPTFSLESAPADVATAQHVAESTLTPLTLWMHSLGGHQLAKGEQAKYKCH
jgi:hypothetical protein